MLYSKFSLYDQTALALAIILEFVSSSSSSGRGEVGIGEEGFAVDVVVDKLAFKSASAPGYSVSSSSAISSKSVVSPTDDAADISLSPVSARERRRPLPCTGGRNPVPVIPVPVFGLSGMGGRLTAGSTGAGEEGFKLDDLRGLLVPEESLFMLGEANFLVSESGEG